MNFLPKIPVEKNARLDAKSCRFFYRSKVFGQKRQFCSETANDFLVLNALLTPPYWYLPGNCWHTSHPRHTFQYHRSHNLSTTLLFQYFPAVCSHCNSATNPNAAARRQCYIPTAGAAWFARNPHSMHLSTSSSTIGMTLRLWTCVNLSSVTIMPGFSWWVGSISALNFFITW